LPEKKAPTCDPSLPSQNQGLLPISSGGTGTGQFETLNSVGWLEEGLGDWSKMMDCFHLG